MDNARRDFLKTSATTTAALTIGALVPDTATAADAPAIETTATAAAPAETPALAMEKKLVKAQPVPLGRVRLTGGPLKHAQDITRDYL
ncbi:MAG: twin-arginine translocation signal domain-containing protein, partial [Gemmatimonadaceae bacterium]|nr:twin-arginine translocation signal domain-containing protein [Gemmatimonadaceae bacterium]